MRLKGWLCRDRVGDTDDRPRLWLHPDQPRWDEELQMWRGNAWGWEQVIESIDPGRQFRLSPGECVEVTLTVERGDGG